MKPARPRIIDALGRSDLFAGLSRHELQGIADQAFPRTYERGRVIFVAGERAAGVYILSRGVVRILRQNADGREQVLSVEYPVSILGDVAVLDGGGYCASAIAQQDSEVLFIAHQDFERLCREYPAIVHRAVHILALRVREYADLVEALSLHDVNRRVAWFLLRQASYSCRADSQSVAVELTWTHLEIASHLGTVREMVTRAFTHLHRTGLIEGKGRVITIPSPGELAAYAGR